jgi:hypothetical protein
VGTVAWTNPGNAGASDNSYATCSLSISAQSHYLKATNFGFSIPTEATIAGIVVEIERNGTSPPPPPGISDNRVRIVKGGTIGSTNKTDGNWPSSDAYSTYGADDDLWGETWTPADINASTFGVAISAAGVAIGGTSANIDHIRVTVYYL